MTLPWGVCREDIINEVFILKKTEKIETLNYCSPQHGSLESNTSTHISQVRLYIQAVIELGIMLFHVGFPLPHPPFPFVLSVWRF